MEQRYARKYNPYIGQWYITVLWVSSIYLDEVTIPD